MRRQYSASLFLLMASLLLAVSLTEDTREAATASSEGGIKFPLWPTRHVRITNDLGKGRVLKIHCKSKNDDLGVHNLSFQSTYQWKFRSNIFLRVTLFYCYMWWGKVEGSFNVYEAARDDKKCEDCKWSIRTDGAYWFDPQNGHWNLLYRWPKT
ncbi:S-protein homolog 5-like [Prosopis cineraria]|uniref:S-protein homolog 5-like n=1 Tax=Prosopis cineraria TaxID=364024 RepID=UPI002410AE58|nr:S-protein homolog 5-like [Prosopis cineraria]